LQKVFLANSMNVGLHRAVEPRGVGTHQASLPRRSDTRQFALIQYPAPPAGPQVSRVAKSAGAHFLGMATSSPEGYWVIPTDLEAGNDQDYLSTAVC